MSSISPTPYSTAHGAEAAINPFDNALVLSETAQFNADMLAKLAALNDPWSVPAHVIREARAQNEGPFPLQPRLDRATWVEHEGVRLRVVEPSAAEPRGVFVHIHGGGWRYGQADAQDQMLGRLADACELTVASVDYRLAPEHMFPAAPSDCLVAASWAFSTGLPLFFGGDSAGGHLSLLTALALRDQGIDCAGLVLIAGAFDLSLTAGARNWGSEKLILNTRDLELFVQNFVPTYMDRRSPQVSPLYAYLEGLPPCFLTVGTQDPLLDDSLFLHQRLQAACVSSELAVAPGGCHVFHAFDLQIAREAEAGIHAFINSRFEGSA